MIDNVTCIHIGNRFQREPPALLLLLNPGRQGLFYHPPSRALQASGQFVYLFRKRQRHMCGDHLGDWI